MKNKINGLLKIEEERNKVKEKFSTHHSLVKHHVDVQKIYPIINMQNTLVGLVKRKGK
jgi:cobyrinic acid a,c-diamide synthase